MNKKTRIERDSMGEIEVDTTKFWGANTERSRRNFKIGMGAEDMPLAVVKAIATIKAASATANLTLKKGKMTQEKCDLINQVACLIIDGEMDGEFPLVVFQTGSGTQSNMNVNEVIANKGNSIIGKQLLHPNDDVNMSQSTNDVFPAAMHVASVIAVEDTLIPAASTIISTLKDLEKQYAGIKKCGRTHLQDATPLLFSDEISGWRSSIEKDVELITMALKPLRELALGGTAVGNGINTPEGYAEVVVKEVSRLTGKDFFTSKNKFHSLTSKDEMVFMHGAIKALAMDLHKIANDIRLLASGPRCGIGEITIPENEPGSSIMPGKVNPTQCEAMTMVSAQILGNDTAISFASSMGQLQLNVYMPVIIYDFLQSVRLLSEAMTSLDQNCLKGLTPNTQKMQQNLDNSLMRVTALTPIIGYEKAAEIAKKAHKEGTTLKDACLALGYLSVEELDKILK